MGKDKETKENILQSAKQEFMEKGYMQASLRNICKNAGVTTGALYFFFQDKEDLFASLVSEPLEQIKKIMDSHYSLEMDEVPQNLEGPMEFSDDIAVSKQIIQFMYQYQDEFFLLFEKSQGTRFENIIDTFVEITHKHNKYMAERITKLLGMPEIDDDVVHWISHITIYAHVMLFTHEKSGEEAMKKIEDIIRFVIAGWIDMLGLNKLR